MVLFVIALALTGVVLCVVTGHWWWIIGLPMGFLLLMAYGTVLTWRSVERQRRLYFELLSQGLSPVDALVQVSNMRHPELSPQTHLRIINAFPDIDRFIGFMEYAADFGKKRLLRDKEVLALIASTEIVYQGASFYAARIDRKRFNAELDKMGGRPVERGGEG
jgi:hypothetical protein